jgi:hypothetical protein
MEDSKDYLTHISTVVYEHAKFKVQHSGVHKWVAIEGPGMRTVSFDKAETLDRFIEALQELRELY